MTHNERQQELLRKECPTKAIVNADRIISIVSYYEDVEGKDLFAAGRQTTIILDAKRLIYFFLKEAGMTFLEIAEKVGKYDRDISRSYNIVKKAYAAGREYREHVDAIKVKIEA